MANVLMAMFHLHSPAERIKEYREYGVTIGKECFIDYMVWIDPPNAKGVIVGDNCCICKGVTILAHDSSLSTITDFPVLCKITTIKNNVYIGTNATIMSGVTVGENSIIGACSVVTKNIPSNEVWAGNPAKFIKTLEQFHAEKQAELSTNPEGIEYLYHTPESRPPIEDMPIFEER